MLEPLLQLPWLAVSVKEGFIVRVKYFQLGMLMLFRMEIREPHCDENKVVVLLTFPHPGGPNSRIEADNDLTPGDTNVTTRIASY